MRKLLLLMSLAIAGILSGFAQSPESIRREFEGNLPVIKQNLPRKVNDKVTWKSLDYSPKHNMITLVYEYADVNTPLDVETTRDYYEKNLGTLRDAYRNSTDMLVKYAVDGEVILRFSYIGKDGVKLATLDYPPSVLK